MKNKTIGEQAELYTSQQYVDYGDYSYRAEEQMLLLMVFARNKNIQIK